ncbi:protein phosphatase 2C family protein isoform X2 [Carex rostrata]
MPGKGFKAISGASVSANATTARTGINPNFSFEPLAEPAASFESTASFAAVPLQPIPRGSGPLNNAFMSGPLERGFASGPLDKGMFMSGPLENTSTTDRANFSAPLSYYGHKRPGLERLVRSMSKPVKRVRRMLLDPVTRLGWNASKELRCQSELSVGFPGGSSEPEYSETRNLQWAHGKAGEDRVHVVLSEEQGWLFVGIYDGFSGPDAPDFLMGNLYKAIDRELEGLLWDYDEKVEESEINVPQPTITIADKNLSCTGDQCMRSCTNKLGETGKSESRSIEGQCRIDRSDCGGEIVEEKGAPVVAGSSDTLGQARKSKRLYELLRMELLEEWNEVGTNRSSDQPIGDEVNDCTDTATGTDKACRQSDGASSSDVGHLQVRRRKHLFGAQLRKMYQKQKSVRKKLFPWNFDWHRDYRDHQSHTDEKAQNHRMQPGTVRRCKSGPVDHDAVLKAMSNALESTEEAYMELVESALDKNPELALMGSCVLVMLMKDQDVYIMNLGDSRVILAQDRAVCENDVGEHRKNRSRESMVRVELDRISEESPIHVGGVNCVNSNSLRGCSANKSKELTICKLKMQAVQLSTDHSTSLDEEVVRIKKEHQDDPQAVFNERVKGQLKVTRAFGAAFLKKQKFNEALLEMFRIDYIGAAPYLSCIPSVLHHRMTSGDRFLVLSSDGLYQYFTNDEVVSHVAWFMENVPEGDPAQYLIAELLGRAAKKNGMDFHELLDIPHGDRRKYHDDVSVMIISLEGRIWRSCG